MSFLETVKAKLGNESYLHIESEAEKEVALAMQMPLLSKYQQENYYTPRFVASELLAEFELFEKVGLKISPTDLVKILFKCKLLFASQSEKEFGQRCGGLYPMLVDSAAVVRWSERAGNIDAIIERHVNQLEVGVAERTLLTHVSSFTAISGDAHPQAFFERLFANVGLPFVCFLDGDLIERHKQFEPGLGSYNLKRGRRIFLCPIIWVQMFGIKRLLLLVFDYVAPDVFEPAPDWRIYSSRSDLVWSR